MKRIFSLLTFCLFILITAHAQDKTIVDAYFTSSGMFFSVINIADFKIDEGTAVIIAALIGVVFNPLLWKKTNDSVGGGGEITKWIIGFFFIFLTITILLYMLLNPSPSEKTAEPKHPAKITGNYFVRMMNGSENVNATITIYSEGREYAMNVYSSKITKKITFSYDPSNGVIISNELGNGEAKIKELTNEIEITFEGWKLVK